MKLSLFSTQYILGLCIRSETWHTPTSLFTWAHTNQPGYMGTHQLACLHGHTPTSLLTWAHTPPSSNRGAWYTLQRYVGTYKAINEILSNVCLQYVAHLSNEVLSSGLILFRCLPRNLYNSRPKQEEALHNGRAGCLCMVTLESSLSRCYCPCCMSACQLTQCSYLYSNY